MSGEGRVRVVDGGVDDVAATEGESGVREMSSPDAGIEVRT